MPDLNVLIPLPIIFGAAKISSSSAAFCLMNSVNVNAPPSTSTLDMQMKQLFSWRLLNQ